LNDTYVIDAIHAVGGIHLPQGYDTGSVAAEHTSRSGSGMQMKRIAAHCRGKSDSKWRRTLAERTTQAAHLTERKSMCSAHGNGDSNKVMAET